MCRYRVQDSEGNVAGFVDGKTLDKWYTEGKISPADLIYDVQAMKWLVVADLLKNNTLEYVEKRSFLDGHVRVVVGNLVRQRVDAIVNAANSTILGGGGIDGAIHEAGGQQIIEECQQIRATVFPDGVPTGSAVLTTVSRLTTMTEGLV
jgi:hypothetical protein